MTTLNTYYSVCEKLENTIIDVDRCDKQNSHQLLDKINNWIESSTIFICDITPDTLNENIEYIIVSSHIFWIINSPKSDVKMTTM